LLLYRIGWNVQVPARQAAERDEVRIARRPKVDWPVVKGRRRTWAPEPTGRAKRSTSSLLDPQHSVVADSGRHIPLQT
jgi:hypothetical protein